MNRWYLGVPLAGLFLFGVVYVQFEKRYEAVEAAAVAAAEAARIEEQQRQEEARREAIEQQRQIIETRRLEREAEMRRDEAAARLRAELEAERAEAVAQANADLRANVTLEQKLAFEQELLRRVQARQASLTAEKEFLAEYILAAVENQERLLALLKDYRAAEEARETLRQDGLLSDAERARR